MALAATTAGLIVAADALMIGAYVTVVEEYDIFKLFGHWAEGILFGIGGGFLVLGFCVLCLLFFLISGLRLSSTQLRIWQR